jgi:deoxyxylulose-5-phosphate synthase
VPVKCFAIPDHFVPHGNRNQLLGDVGLTPESVAGYVGAKLMGEKVVPAERFKAAGEE